MYGYNSSGQAKNMSTEVTHSISVLMKKCQGALLIMGGDFNDAPDGFLDRFPPHTSTSSKFKFTTFLSSQLSIVDIWRFLNCIEFFFSWSNSSRSLQSRIDLWFVSPDCVQYVTYSYAPLSDHIMFFLVLSGCKIKNNNLRGYWKLNNNLLCNKSFVNQVREIAQHIFSNKQMTYIKKWKLFKFKVRQSAIHFSKQAKNNSLNKEQALMTELDNYLKKITLQRMKKLNWRRLKLKLIKYMLIQQKAHLFDQELGG